MKRALVVLAFLLSACTVTPTAAQAVSLPTAGLVIQQATAEAALSVATEIAARSGQATEDARATQGAATLAAGDYQLGATATEDAWRRRVTEAAATTTRQAVEAQQTSGAALSRGAATAQADRLALMGTQTAGNIMRGELTRTSTTAGVVLVSVALALGLVLLAIAWAQMLITTERARREAEIDRLRAEADKARIMQTAIGLAICEAGAWRVIAGQAEPREDMDIVEHVPYHVGGRELTLAIRRDDPARRRVIRLLRAAVAENGRDGSTLPPAHVLGWSTSEWQAAVNYLAGRHLVWTRRGRGGGVFVMETHRDLGRVLDAVLSTPPLPDGASGAD